jgi:hypothetical protein
MKHITLYKDIPLRNGIILKKGTKGTISPIMGSNGVYASTICNLCVDGYDTIFKALYTSVCKQPSVTSLINWSEIGVCKSVNGKRIEPDGYDNDGFPSWLLVVGLI